MTTVFETCSRIYTIKKYKDRQIKATLKFQNLQYITLQAV